MSTARIASPKIYSIFGAYIQEPLVYAPGKAPPSGTACLRAVLRCDRQGAAEHKPKLL
jgi:hypothetical protein